MSLKVMAAFTSLRKQQKQNVTKTRERDGMDVARVALMELFRDEITCCAPSRHDGRPFLVGIWYTSDRAMIGCAMKVEIQTMVPPNIKFC